ncbi:hypothetical protein F511_41360 [Dorcoceras hygrometricum]|uniref:Uncharacterized protein n=1 Tax=Dorcoceras hygrometricum TaxID=472368 RepID=A0A2Z6ZZW8_9LAMI|nr:hypothetical protein F511_41360 [Dorcoceras hygrometricum]
MSNQRRAISIGGIVGARRLVARQRVLVGHLGIPLRACLDSPRQPCARCAAPAVAHGRACHERLCAPHATLNAVRYREHVRCPCGAIAAHG